MIRCFVAFQHGNVIELFEHHGDSVRPAYLTDEEALGWARQNFSLAAAAHAHARNLSGDRLLVARALFAQVTELCSGCGWSRAVDSTLCRGCVEPARTQASLGRHSLTASAAPRPRLRMRHQIVRGLA